MTKKQSTWKTREIGPVLDWQEKGSTLLLKTGEAEVWLTALSPDLIRIQMVPEESEPVKHSYAVAVSNGHWPACQGSLREGEHTLLWETRCGERPGLIVEITKTPFRLQIKRRDGSSVAAAAQAEGFSVIQKENADSGSGLVGSSWALQAPLGTRYYGFGQKPGFLDKRGRRLSFWATDETLHTPDNDELYQAIPFALSLDEKGRSAGIFVDCTARVTCDVAKSQSEIFKVEAMQPVLDSYVFAGPGPKDVIGQYTELTGRMELPPLWALGYQQSRYSYYPEEQVRRIALEMRARGLPCDVIYLDIHYMDGYRVFTWDEERFPNPRKMIEDLAAQGFKTVTIIDPGVKVDGRYEVFQEGIRQGNFICWPDGELFIGTVWPGRTAFPDFLREKTRLWWGDLHQGLLEAGVAGIWNDMNEPSCFARNTLPDEVLQGEDGQQLPHSQVHNAYGLTMAMATHAALRRLRPGKRPFLLTRSGYAGIQRYAAVWMGDNHSWWEHLRMSISMCLGMGLSGVPFVGSDIGGFSGDAQGELFVRWIQAGAFMPFYRNHSALGTARQEPWSFGPQVENIARKFLRLRYRLLPFLYNEFYRACQTGLPIMRPLFLEYPTDLETFHLSDQFLVGRDLLVCPVYQPGREKRLVYLPAGEWVDFWTGRYFAGSMHLAADAPLDRLPLFVRAGAILPMETPVDHTGERDGRLLFLHAYVPSRREVKKANSDVLGQLRLYEDQGEGFAYKEGQWAETSVFLRRSERGLTLEVGEPEGRFAPPRERVQVHLYVDESDRELIKTGKIKAAGTPVKLKEKAEIDLSLAAPQAAFGSLGELVVVVSTPNAAGFVLEIEA